MPPATPKSKASDIPIRRSKLVPSMDERPLFAQDKARSYISGNGFSDSAAECKMVKVLFQPLLMDV